MKIHFTTILLLYGGYCFGQEWTTAAKPATVTADSIVLKDAIRIWPNPAVNDIYITIKQTGLLIRNILLYDQSGNKLLERKISSALATPIKISVAHLPAGNYFVMAETNRQPVRLQLIKQ